MNYKEIDITSKYFASTIVEFAKSFTFSLKLPSRLMKGLEKDILIAQIKTKEELILKKYC